ncbi:MAG: DUF5676 family membrane protein [Longimicrobiales bacterium]
MRIQPRYLFYAAGITAALVSTVCAALLAVAPSATIRILGLAVHEDLGWLAPRVTWASYFAGLLFWGLGTGLVFGFAGWLYDRLARSSPTV